MLDLSNALARGLLLPAPGTESFFLWGPRQTGKSTLLRQLYPDALWLDLLKTEDYRRFLARPELLREELTVTATPGQQVVIDEIQKVPALLDEVHWLIENRGLHFALCGSSARKLRRGAANLLGGRALRFELHGLTAHELGASFDLTRLLNHGALPDLYRAKNPAPRLRAYVADYLKEEVAAEGLTRNLPAFSNFLDIAALSDGEQVNHTNIARQCGVSAPTVNNYFQILEDTLLGTWLPVYRTRPKQRTSTHPKFYWSDTGVVNCLARRGELLPGGELYGKAFESWVFHELRAFQSYRAPELQLFFWRLAGGTEVDFILGDMAVAIEAKAGEHITTNDMRGLRKLRAAYPQLERRIIVSREPRPRTTADGIEVLPYTDFIHQLWTGHLTPTNQPSLSY